MSDVAPVQRIRVVFSKGEAVKYISHLAVMRAWERIMRRAEVPIAYSLGFNPRPKLTFASALAVGHTGRAEIMDVELIRPMEPRELLQRLSPQLPPGFGVHAADEAPVRAPALQAEMRYAVYRVSLAPDVEKAAIEEALEGLLGAPSLPRQRELKGRLRDYDLRPLIRDLWYAGPSQAPGETLRADTQRDVRPGPVLGMTLVNDNTAAGRPDEVLSQLGWSGALRSIERVRLVFRGDADDAEALRPTVDGG